MKKIIATITLITFFACYPAFAFAPVAIPLWYYGASVALHVSAAAAGLYYAMKPNNPTAVSTSGDLSRPSSAVWVDLKDFKPSLNEKNVSAKMPYSKAQELAEKKENNADLYPNIKSAMKTVNPNYNPLVGDIINNTNVAGLTAGGNYRVNSKAWDTPICKSYVGAPYMSSGKLVINVPAGHTCTGADHALRYIGLELVASSSQPNVFLNSTSIGTQQPATGQEFKDKVAPTGSVSNSAYQAELDRMFQDPDYVPTFSDDTTGLPFSPPAGILSPTQLAAANASAVAQEAKTTAATSTTAAAAAASGSADAVRNAYVASGGDPSTGVGGDQALYQKLKEQEAAAAAAQAELDKLKAEQARDDAEKLSITVPALESYGDGTEYKFGDRFNQFFDDMKQSSVFSLPGQMLGSIPGGGQSYFNLSFGRFGQTTFDLASYGASINIIKTLVLIIFSIAGIRIVTLKGGS